MSVLGADTTNFNEGPGFWLSAFLVLIVVMLVTAISFGVRARFHSRAVGAASTAWASGVLVLLRLFLVFFVVLLVGFTFSHDSSRTLGVVESSHGHLVVHAETSQTSVLCPLKRDQDGNGGTQLDQPSCAASEVAGRARIPNGGQLQGLKVDLPIARSRPSERREFKLLSVADLAIFLIGVLAIERIVWRTTKRQPFSLENVRWLRVLAACVLLDAFVVVILENDLADALIRHHWAGSDAIDQTLRRPDFTQADLMPLVVTILILVLAEIWRFGIRLQADVEATV